MNVPRGTFKPIKSVCQRCMAKYSVPFGFDLGTCVSKWTQEDQYYFDRGLVWCPKAVQRSKPTRKFCLCVKEMDAVNSGCISVWDDKSL